MTITRTRTVSGYVDGTVFHHEFGETSGPLTIYATREELERESPGAEDDPTWEPIYVTVTYAYPTTPADDAAEQRFRELFSMTWEP